MVQQLKVERRMRKRWFYLVYQARSAVRTFAQAQSALN